jgi:hypothetical protein
MSTSTDVGRLMRPGNRRMAARIVRLGHQDFKCYRLCLGQNPPFPVADSTATTTNIISFKLPASRRPPECLPTSVSSTCAQRPAHQVDLSPGGICAVASTLCNATAQAGAAKTLLKRRAYRSSPGMPPSTHRQRCLGIVKNRASPQ